MLLSHNALAADVVCTPDPSGTAIASAAETCSGVGDKIKYDTLPATVSSTVTLNGVVITGTAPGTTDAVAINPGTSNVTILTNGVGSITSVAGNGINVTATAGTGTISVGTAANRINVPVAGGNGLNTAQGINVVGRGDINIYTGTVPITGTSTGGGSWSIFARDTLAGSGPGGAVVVDAQGALLAGRGSILATTAGTDATDSVTVTTTGAVTGLAGAGIQTSSVNGATTITASGPVIGSIGTGTVGISETITGTGNAVLTTLTGGTVTGNGGAQAIVVATGSGGMNVNIGANVTSTANNAIKTTNSTATGTNSITIGAAAIKGLGTSTTTAVINLTTASGGLTTLTTGASTSISSDSATVAAQNGDLAIKGAGGSIVFNNGGSLRGVVDFSGISVATNNVTFNNSSASSWHTTGISNFSAGNDAFNNTGLLQAGEAPGASTTIFTSLETFNNAGTISLQDGETNDSLQLVNTAYVSSGSAKISLDAALGAASQTSCVNPVAADCVVMGASSGTGTVLSVNDTNTGAGALNYAGLIVIDATSASAGNFTLGGANVTATAQGPAIVKRFVQYQLFYNAANANFLLAGVPSGAMMEVASATAGVQSVWQDSASAESSRMASLRDAYAAGQGASDGLSLWATVFGGDLSRDDSQSVNVVGNTLLYDTSYSQNTSGFEFGLDEMTGGEGGVSWVFGAMGGYASSVMHFDADGTRADNPAWNIGGYASYMDGKFFTDLLIKADFATVKFVLPVGVATTSINGNSLGGRLAAGEHLADGGVMIEPMASLSYFQSTLDRLSDPSATFDFGNGNSLRGSLGVRLSTKLDDSDTAQPFLLLDLNQEYAGANWVTVTSGSTNFAYSDKPTKTFGSGSVGLNFSAVGGLFAFFAVDGQFGGNTTGWGLRVGLRHAT
jgi:hypothetical protein